MMILESSEDVTRFFGHIAKHISDGNSFFDARQKATRTTENYEHWGDLRKQDGVLAAHYKPHLESELNLHYARNNHAINSNEYIHGVKAYCSTYFKAINNHRFDDQGDYEGVHPKLLRRWKEDIQNTISKAPALPEDVHVYAGLRPGRDGAFKSVTAGSSVDFKAFSSTSITPFIAAGFSSNIGRFLPNPNSNESHLIHAKLLAGTRPGIYVDPVSPCIGEHEFLLNAGTKATVLGSERFRFSDHRTNNYGTIVVHHLDIHNAD